MPMRHASGGISPLHESPPSARRIGHHDAFLAGPRHTTCPNCGGGSLSALTAPQNQEYMITYSPPKMNCTFLQNSQRAKLSTQIGPTPVTASISPKRKKPGITPGF
jgi:hypothetical protein